MGKWIKQPGERFETGDDGQARLTQVFHAERGQGVAEATKRGLVRGSQMFKDGRQLALASINPRTTESVDEVEISWIGPGGSPPPPRKAQHLPGDEEWSMESGMDNWDESQGPFYNADGDQKNPPATLKTVRQPKAFLVWKKWLKTPWKYGPKELPRILPKTKTDAFRLFGTYTNGANPIEENAPRIGCTLGNGAETYFLCVDISIEPDGNLLCRTAKFEYSNIQFNPDLYPTP